MLYHSGSARFYRSTFSFRRRLGPENQRHSHHYRVEVQLEGTELDQHGYLVDIVDIETQLEALVAYYRDKTLNELPEFKDLNPA